jgi:hypothetical protein
MRTVAFSDAGIVKFLNDKFVCAWVNKRPDLKFKDGLYANQGRRKGLPNGAAVANVTAVFAAPDGTVIHAIPGYLDIPAFKRQLEFALELNARLLDPAVRRQDRAGLYAEAHRKAAQQWKNEVEGYAHKLLAPRLMRVDELPLHYFDGTGKSYV